MPHGESMQTGFPIALVAVRERQGLFATFAYNSNSTHGCNYNYCRVVDTDSLSV